MVAEGYRFTKLRCVKWGVSTPSHSFWTDSASQILTAVVFHSHGRGLGDIIAHSAVHHFALHSMSDVALEPCSTLALNEPFNQLVTCCKQLFPASRHVTMVVCHSEFMSNELMSNQYFKNKELYNHLCLEYHHGIILYPFSENGIYMSTGHVEYASLNGNAYFQAIGEVRAQSLYKFGQTAQQNWTQQNVVGAIVDLTWNYIYWQHSLGCTCKLGLSLKQVHHIQSCYALDKSRYYNFSQQ